MADLALFVYVAAVLVAAWAISVLNKIADKPLGGAPGGRPGFIQNNTTEIITAMYDENRGFDVEDFQMHAKEVFKALKNAYFERDIDKLPFSTREQYLQHRTQIDKYISEGQISVTEIENFDKIYLYKYNKTAEYDYLTVFLEIFGAEYDIDGKTREIVPGCADDNQLLRYLLTFRRDGKVLENTVKETPQSLACPKCGAPAVINNVGKCSYCGAVIKDGNYAWALDGFAEVWPDYSYAPGGVFINDIQTERYKNGIN